MFFIFQICFLVTGFFTFTKVYSDVQQPYFCCDLGIPDDYEKYLPKRDINLPQVFDWRDHGTLSIEQNSEREDVYNWQFVADTRKLVKVKGGELIDYNNVVSKKLLESNCEDSKEQFPSLCLQFWYRNARNNQSRYNYKESSYYKIHITGRMSEIKNYLYRDGPAYALFDLYDDFIIFWEESVIGSLYNHNYLIKNSENRIKQIVLIIGWNDEKKAWLCRHACSVSDADKDCSGPNGDGTFWLAYRHDYNLFSYMINVKQEEQ